MDWQNDVGHASEIGTLLAFLSGIGVGSERCHASDFCALNEDGLPVPLNVTVFEAV